nr:hypothetical protein [uncultured Roseateles sp.]
MTPIRSASPTLASTQRVTGPVAIGQIGAAAAVASADETRRRMGAWLIAGAMGTVLGAAPITSHADPDEDGFRIGGKPGRGWRMIGQVQARRSVDRDEIRVRADRAFSAIRLRVFNARVEMLRLRIQFRNGQWRDIEVRQYIERGGATRIIDLPGEKRFIDRIVFWHKTPIGARERANVQVWARG